MRRLRGVDLRVRNVGDQQVLPDGQADLAVAAVAAMSARPRICSAVMLPTGSTTPT